LIAVAVIPCPPSVLISPNAIVLVSFRITLFPVTMVTVPKSLSLSRVILLPLPASSVTVPEAVKSPISVIAPPEIKSRSVTLHPAITVAESSVIVMVPPLTSRLPKFVVSVTSSPNVTSLSPESNVAWFVTDSVVPAMS